MDKYTVRIYYSTYCEYEIEAKNENEAFDKSKKLEIDSFEILNNLEVWDEAIEIEKA